MHVRSVRPDEWRDLRALRLRALASDPVAFGRTFAEEEALPDEHWQTRALGSEDLAIFVAVLDAALVGMAGAHWERAQEGHERAGGEDEGEDEGTASLWGMWLAPEARGSGAAGALIRAVVDWARHRKATRVRLWVNVEQARALRVYAREGFVRVGEPEAGTRFPERMFQRMEKPLAAQAT